MKLTLKVNNFGNDPVVKTIYYISIICFHFLMFNFKVCVYFVCQIEWMTVCTQNIFFGFKTKIKITKQTKKTNIVHLQK